MRMREIMNLVETITPKLTSAVMVNGVVYTGRYHLDALAKIEDPVARRRAILDGTNRGFVDHRGHFLNRVRAFRYAMKHDLIDPKWLHWFNGADPRNELIAEMLRDWDSSVIDRDLEAERDRIEREDALAESVEPGTITYHLEQGEHAAVWWVIASDDEDRMIGHAKLQSLMSGGYYVAFVMVHDSYRRNGIASAMYDFAYKNGFAPLYPDVEQTKDGKALWRGNRKSWFSKREWGAMRGLASERTSPPVGAPAERLAESIESGLVKLYHITDKANFKLNPNYAPADNSFAIADRSGHKGIYLAKNVETWVNGHGYVRPFVAEIYADPSALEHDRIGRWGGEVFIPADQFDKLRVNRVVPLDVIAREEYGLHGWIEGRHGHEFDTGNEITAKGNEQPFRGWTYDRDVRNMSPEEVRQIKQRFKAGYKVWRRERGS